MLMTRDQTIAALNEWTARRFLNEVAAGHAPTYGESSMALLEEYHARLTAPDTSLPCPSPAPAAVPA